MELKIRITAHVYAEGKFCDNVLISHNKNYGIIGKNIISPLRKINGKEWKIKGASESYTIKDLWNEIDARLFAYGLNPDSIKDHNIIEKYLVYDNLRYSVEDINKPVINYLNILGASLEDWIDIQLLVSENAGEVLQNNGIHYYIKSKEAGRHHIPHVHVNVKHEVEGSFSIENGEKLAGGKFKGKDLRTIKSTILENQKFLYQQWDLCTDGLKVDLDQGLELKP